MTATIDAAIDDLDRIVDAKLDQRQWAELNADFAQRARLIEGCRDLVRAAFEEGDAAAVARVHDVLARIYDQAFAIPDVSRADCEDQPVVRDIAAVLEQAILDHETAAIGEGLVTGYPVTGKEYVRWLKVLIADHEASHHVFYREFLPTRGTQEDIRYLLAQETSLDPRFDDILALIQIGTHGAEKMEIAANYWDEMGNGEHADVHTTMFSTALDAVDATPDYIAENLLAEAKLCGNLSAALAISRRHYYKAIGYFGVTEYLAPRRFRSLVDAWRKLGLSEAGARYHDLHIGIDAGHAAGWYKNVIGPIIEKDPAAGREIAIGTLIRLNTSKRYLDVVLARSEAKHAG